MFGRQQTVKGKAELALSIALETRRFEIDKFWTRSLFFWGFIAAAAVAFASDGISAEPLARLSLACFGALASLAWTLANRGSKYWHEAWEVKVQRLEREVFGISQFGSTEPMQSRGLWGARRYSVTKLAMALSDLTLLMWLGTIFVLLEVDPKTTFDLQKLGLATAAFGVAILMLVCGRSGTRTWTI